MAPVTAGTSPVVNALATPAQLASSNSQLDGVTLELERSIIFAAARLTQTAGILLRLPQDIIAQAIVIFTRFWIGPDGGSLRRYDAQDVSAASLYLTAKLSTYPKSPRSVINVFAYIDSFPTTFTSKTGFAEGSATESYYVSEGTFEARRAQMVNMETIILRTLGFQTHVALPYNICINYLQTLDAFAEPEAGQTISKRAFAHLNTALLSPQLLYLTHQPSSLATAAIYLAAKEVQVKLPGDQWWEVFDTDREELGFLVVAMISMEGFAKEEEEKWTGQKVPSKA